MELRDLRVFATTAEVGGMTRAAGRLHMVQSAVSQAVRRLEDELGLVLLERRSDGVRPTEAGAALARHAALILNTVGRAEEDMAAFRGLARGTVDLGIVHTAAPIVLTPLLARLRARHPGLSLRVHEAMAAELADGLRMGGLDVVVAFLPLDDDLEVVGVARLGLSVIVGAEHPRAGRRRVRLGDLAAEPWVAFPPDNPGRRWLEDACAAAGFTPRIEVEVETFAQLEAFVEVGAGIGMVPPGVAAAECQAGRLSLLELAAPAPSVGAGYAYDPRQPSPAVSAVRGLLEETLRGLAG